jgi:mono/diheme cytochrome c family protein
MKRNLFALVAGLGLLLMPAAQATDESPVIHRVALSSDCLRTVDGETLYGELCVVCHGPSGGGDGGAAELLNPRPPDLTRLTAGNGGRFPSLRVLYAISGQHRAPVLGSEMPEWESILGADTGARLRVYNLLQYVKEIQVASLDEDE